MADNAGGKQGVAAAHWHAAPAASATQSGRGLRIVLAAFLFALVACGIILVRLLKPAPDAFFLSVYVNEYQARPFPFVAFAGEDSGRLRRHFPRHRVPETKTKELLRKELDDLAQAATWGNGPLIFHLNTLALVRDGSVFLLPANADPHGNGDDQVPLEEVLAAVKECPARQKLLILDLAHPMADVRLGVLADRMAAVLQERLRRDEPDFFVWCACAGGQLSLTSEALQSSVLAYFLDRGLSGEADGAGSDGAIDGRVTVGELFSYTQDAVKNWAWQNGQQQQTPLSFGKAADFVLVKSPWADAVESQARPYLKELREGWAKRDAWQHDPDVPPDPQFVLRLSADLLRQDERWRSRTDAAEVPAEVGRMVWRAAEERGQFKVPQIPLRSLQQGATSGSGPAEEAMRDLLVAKKTADKGEKKPAPDKLKDEKPAVKARALLTVLAGFAELHPGQVDTALEILGPYPQEEQPVELLYLRRLQKFFKNRPDRPQRPYLAALFFKTLCARETALTELAREPFPLPWVAGLLEQGDKDRRLGETQLLHGSAKSWPRPDSPDDNPLERAQKTYEAARTAIAGLQGCRAVLARATVFLPGLVPIAQDAATVDAWSEAADLLGKLQTLLNQQARNDAAELSQCEVHRYKLEKCLTDLRGKLERRVRDAGPHEAVLLLKSPLLTAGQRESLWAMDAHLSKLVQESDNRPPSSFASVDPFPQSRLRARLGLGLARLGKRPGLADLESAFAAAKSSADIDRLERAFRKANTTTTAKPTTAAYRRPERWQDFAQWLAGRYDYERRFREETADEREMSQFCAAMAAELSRWGLHKTAVPASLED